MTYVERGPLKEAEEAVVAAITAQAPEASPASLLKLAEALAWIKNPGQSHGGGSAPTA